MDDCRENKASSDPVSTFAFQVSSASYVLLLVIANATNLPADLVSGATDCCSWKSFRLHSSRSSTARRESNRFSSWIFPSSKDDESLQQTVYVTPLHSIITPL
jgi:hypothetical protein